MSPEASAQISCAIRNAIGRTPLILKIGLFERREQAVPFVAAVSEHTTALSTVNSITATVAGSAGESLFRGLMRGIGGVSIRDRSNLEIAMLHEIISSSGSGLRLIGVGGVSTAADVRARLAAGAHHVQMATAAMLDPEVGVRIRRELAAAGA